MSLTLSIPAVLIGFLAGFFLRRFLTSRSVAQAEAKAQQILAESKTKGQEVVAAQLEEHEPSTPGKLSLQDRLFSK